MCLPVRRHLVADEVSDIEKSRVRMTLLNLVASWIFAADSTCDVGVPDYGKGFDTAKPEVSKVNLKLHVRYQAIPVVLCVTITCA